MRIRKLSWPPLLAASLLLQAASASAVPDGDAFPEPDSARLAEVDDYQDPEAQQGAHFKWDWLDEKLDPWQQFKNRLNEEWGLDFFIAYSPQFQGATQEDKNTNIAQELDLIGEWRFFDDETFGKGRLQFWFLTVQTLGDHRGGAFQQGSGSIWELNDLDTGKNDQLNAIGFLAWEQLMFDDHLRVVFGKLDPRLLLNTNRYLWDDRVLFNMGTMVSDPVVSLNGSRGIGAFSELRFGGFYVSGIWVDASAKNRSIDFKRVDNGHYSWGAEIGFETEIDGLGEGNYRTSWFSTDSTGRGASGKSVMGNAISVDQDLGDNFAFFGYWSRRSGGMGSLEQNLSTGFVMRQPFGIKHDLVGIGFTWGRPDGSTKDDQYGIEAFWRFQILDRLEFSPLLQYIIKPVNSSTDTRLVGGLRLRLYL